MKISVIVPFWNAARWILRCLCSLQNQTGDFEFVIVDDGSTDGGRIVAESFAADDRRFRVMGNRRKKGVSGARNTGIDAATGEWITFLDADDEMLPGAFDAFRAVIEADPRANIHQLNHLRYYTEIDKLTMKLSCTNDGGVYGFGNLPRCWYYVWNKIIRREFLADIRFDERLLYGEDSLFALECFAKDGYIHHGDGYLAAVKHRFDNKQSLSHIKTPDDIRMQIRAHEEFFDRQTDPAIQADLCGIIASQWNDALAKRLKR